MEPFQLPFDLSEDEGIADVLSEVADLEIQDVNDDSIPEMKVVINRSTGQIVMEVTSNES